MHLNIYILICWITVVLQQVGSTSASNSNIYEGCKFNDGKVDDQNKAVTCYLNTLQQHQSGGNMYFDDVTKLTVQCVFSKQRPHAESHLKSNHFATLNALTELDLIDCHLRQIPSRAFTGLSNLHSLVIQTSRSTHSDYLPLELKENAFLGLDNIHSLDLSFNNLWNLPKHLLCPISRTLSKLNLSFNRIVEFSDIGVSHSQSSCDETVMAIKYFDISHNSITHLHRLSHHLGGERPSQNLLFLDLSYNEISVMGDSTFSGLTQLASLDLSFNKLTTLPHLLLNETTNLEKIHLQNNSLSLIPSHFFIKQSSLLLLNLSTNAITSNLITSRTFAGLSNLQVLDISFNELTQLDSIMLHHLTGLHVLHAHNNKLHTIESDALSRQPSMQILSLAFNQLVEINNSTLHGMNSLKSLALDNNRLNSVELGHRLASNLTSLSLNRNNLIEIPKFVQTSCGNITTLDLGHNEIISIKDDDLLSLSNLYALGLAGNRLSQIANSTFHKFAKKNEGKLHILNLAQNQLTNIEVGTFGVLENLQALRLDSNLLTDMNGLIYNLPRLEWVNVSSNALSWFDYAFIPPALRWLDVSYNQINELANFYKLDNFVIETLIADYNLVTSIGPSSFSSSLRNIRLANNNIALIQPFTFHHLFQLSVVDLSHNYIQSIEKSAFQLHQRINGEAIVSLDDNPLSCDCNMQWMQQHIIDSMTTLNNVPVSNLQSEVDHTKSTLHIKDVYKLKCVVPSKNEVSRMIDVPSSDFLCPYDVHCSSSCMCCDFIACDCRFQCPDGCACFHNANWTQNVVSCSAQSLVHVPILIPLDATSVRLDGNDFRHIETQSFLGRDNIAELYMNNSQIVSIYNNSFAGLEFSLKKLHLENNAIRQIHGFEFNTLINLRELYLHENDIVYINEVSFNDLASLTTLTLNGNLLTMFPIWNTLTSRSHPFLSNLGLSLNTWSCSCDFITPFNQFLEDSRHIIIDYENIQCVTDNRLVNNKVGSTTSGIYCEQVSEISIEDENEMIEEGDTNYSPLHLNTVDNGMNFTSITIPLMALGCIISFTAIFALFIYKNQIKSWINGKHSQCSNIPKLSSNERYMYQSSLPCSSNAPSTSLYETPHHVLWKSESPLALPYSHHYQNENQQKLFDVFVTYSSHDSEIVEKSLIASFERDQKIDYKFCLQQRDFTQISNELENSIRDTVTVAMESSSKTLMVVSGSYVEKMWPIIKHTIMNGGNQTGVLDLKERLVLLYLDDSVNTFGGSQCDDIILNQCPSVRYGESGFMSKLRCLLPETSFLTFQRNVTLRNQTNVNNCVMLNNKNNIRHHTNNNFSSSNATFALNNGFEGCLMRGVEGEKAGDTNPFYMSNISRPPPSLPHYVQSFIPVADTTPTPTQHIYQSVESPSRAFIINASSKDRHSSQVVNQEAVNIYNTLKSVNHHHIVKPNFNVIHSNMLSDRLNPPCSPSKTWTTGSSIISSSSSSDDSSLQSASTCSNGGESRDKSAGGGESKKGWRWLSNARGTTNHSLFVKHCHSSSASSGQHLLSSPNTKDSTCKDFPNTVV